PEQRRSRVRVALVLPLECDLLYARRRHHPVGDQLDPSLAEPRAAAVERLVPPLEVVDHAVEVGRPERARAGGWVDLVNLALVPEREDPLDVDVLRAQVLRRQLRRYVLLEVGEVA